MLYDPRWETLPRVSLVGKVLLEAADIIERGGWCQGRLSDNLGRHCAVGAISVAKGHIEDRLKATGHLRQLLGVAIPLWNDSPDRTAPAVIITLREAAKTAP